jgi:anti-anti-sigma factor
MFVSGGPCLTVRVLYVEGPLRAPVDKALVREVRELIRRGERHFVLDLHRVSQIDAAGVGELVRVYRLTCEANGTFEVLNPTNRVREVLSRAGLLALVKTNGSRARSTRQVPAIGRPLDCGSFLRQPVG